MLADWVCGRAIVSGGHAIGPMNSPPPATIAAPLTGHLPATGCWGWKLTSPGWVICPPCCCLLWDTCCLVGIDVRTQRPTYLCPEVLRAHPYDSNPRPCAQLGFTMDIDDQWLLCVFCLLSFALGVSCFSLLAPSLHFGCLWGDTLSLEFTGLPIKRNCFWRASSAPGPNLDEIPDLELEAGLVHLDTLGGGLPAIWIIRAYHLLLCAFGNHEPQYKKNQLLWPMELWQIR